MRTLPTPHYGGAARSRCAIGLACALMLLSGGCSSRTASTRRIEPGDLVFKSWADLAAYKSDVAAAAAKAMVGVSASDIFLGRATAADLDARAARIKTATAALTVKYRQSGRLWEIPAGTVVTIHGYLDGSGHPTTPKAEGGHLYAADGNTLFAKVTWNGGHGCMALDKAH